MIEAIGKSPYINLLSLLISLIPILVMIMPSAKSFIKNWIGYVRFGIARQTRIRFIANTRFAIQLVNPESMNHYLFIATWRLLYQFLVFVVCLLVIISCFSFIGQKENWSSVKFLFAIIVQFGIYLIFLSINFAFDRNQYVTIMIIRNRICNKAILRSRKAEK